jgi:Ca2+-binding RTX toxin-like protein
MAGAPAAPPGGPGDWSAPEEREPPPVPADGERAEGGTAVDWLVGSEGADDIAGGRGDDTLSGAGGDDLLFGGGGDDVLEGGAGNDSLADGSGSNTLAGGGGDDRLIATPADGAGADAGPDRLDGGEGDDTLTFSSGDIAIGGAGADTFVTGPGLGPPDGSAGPAEIADFDPRQDALVVVWNDYAADHPPEITLAASASEDAIEVRADGELVARVAGDGPLASSDVHLLPTSKFFA